MARFFLPPWMLAVGALEPLLYLGQGACDCGGRMLVGATRPARRGSRGGSEAL